MSSARLVIYRRRLGDFLKQFRESRLGILGFSILLFFIFTAVFANYLSHSSTKATEGVLSERLQPPSPSHWLGTDEVGRDLLTLIMYGGRISLLIGLLAALISGGIGALVGLISGFYGGWKDDVLMRGTDIMMVIPGLPLMVVLAATLGTSFWNIIFVISITGWTGTARIVRAQVLSLKERPFIESVRAIGASDSRIIGLHLLPNIFPLIVAEMVIRIGIAILSEASLAFLGLGDPLNISWGMTLNWAFSCGALSGNYWWYIIPPGICITLVVLGFTFVGYALDQIVNPRIRRR